MSVEHSILCPAYQSPMARLFAGSTGECDCGAGQSVATAVAEPPPESPPVEQVTITDMIDHEAIASEAHDATVTPPVESPKPETQPPAESPKVEKQDAPSEVSATEETKVETPAAVPPAAAAPTAETAAPESPAPEKPKKARTKKAPKEPEQPKTQESAEAPLVQPNVTQVAAVRAAVDLPKDDPTRERLMEPVVGQAPAAGTETPADEIVAPASKRLVLPSRGRLYAGIDPDLQGYVSVLDSTGAIVLCRAIPTTGGQKPVYDEPGMVRLALELKALGVEEVLLERQQPINKINRGKKVVNITAKANFKKGYSYGLWRGILGALGIAFDTIAPITWKRAMAIAGGGPDEVKKRAIDKAQGIFPGVDLRDIERKPKARVPSGSKAESLLLARYVMLTKTGGLTAVRDAEVDVIAESDDTDASDETEGSEEQDETIRTDDGPDATAADATADQPAPATPAQTTSSEAVEPEDDVQGGKRDVESDEVESSETESPGDEPKETETPKPGEELTQTEPAGASPEDKEPTEGEAEWLEKMSQVMRDGKSKLVGPANKKIANAKPVNVTPKATKPAKAPKATKPAPKPKPAPKAAAKKPKPAPKAAAKKPSAKPAKPKGKMTTTDRALQRVLRGL